MRAGFGYLFHSCHHPSGGLRLPQVVQHQGGAPHRRQRVGFAPPGDVGGGAVHRFEQAGGGPGRVQVGGRGHPHGPHQGRSDVGQDVPEQVGGDHHVEFFRMGYESGRQSVDQIGGNLHLRIVPRRFLHHLVPHHRSVLQGVGFGGRSQPPGAGAGGFKPVAHQPLHPPPGVDGGLGGYLPFGSGRQPPALPGVFPFRVFPHQHDVDVAVVFAGQGGADARQSPDGAQVDVLVESLPDGEQQSPQ